MAATRESSLPSSAGSDSRKRRYDNFSQNVALAIIFALAALKLVVIVQVGHSP